MSAIKNNEVEQHMELALKSYRESLKGIRTGRAHPGFLAKVMAPVYGDALSALPECASINASDAITLIVKPHDKSKISIIEKAIRDANLGLNPSTTGDTIRVSMPALTQERRMELTKHVKEVAEQAKIAVRNLRKHANSLLDKELADKLISKDENTRAKKTTQTLTDKYIAIIEQDSLAKQQELLQL